MRWLGTERLSWFWERKLRLEHDLFIVRGKLYPLALGRVATRSKYRPNGTKPIFRWQERAVIERGVVK